MATQIPTPLDPKVKALVFVCLTSNTDDVYLGNSSVSTAGANRGRPMGPDDRGIVPVDGPGADQFYFIRGGAAQTVTVQQWG